MRAFSNIGKPLFFLMIFVSITANMKIVLLGGNSIKNKEWLIDMETAIQHFSNDTIRHNYSHWENSNFSINLDTELDCLRVMLQDFNEYTILAKSAGALLALKGIYEGKIYPSACVFLGTAVLWGKENGYEIEKWLKDYSTPTLFVQNSDDPAISPQDLLTLLQKSSVINHKLIVSSGRGHEYLEYQQIAENIALFLKRPQK